MMIKNVLKVSALVLVLGMAGGCAASQEERDRVQATVDGAARDAAAAKSAAEAARAAADSAAQAARNAQSTADEALSAAEEAQSCCDANRDRLERMFQKSMSK
ncbi:MAG: Lpp/OprI family alanine-zipper lipoprotein [Woeseia sp.]